MQPSPRAQRLRIARRRSRLRATCFLAVAAFGTAILSGTLATATAPSLESEIATAGAEEQRLSDLLGRRQTAIAGLDQRAREAGAEAMRLEAKVEVLARRSAELVDDLRAARRRLEVVRARYRRAVRILSDRVVEIYKSGRPDYISVILYADGFDDLSSRAAYLKALNDEDQRITNRVRSLRGEVKATYSEVAAVKQEIDDDARLLKRARARSAAARIAAENRAAAITRLLDGNRSELAVVRARIAKLLARQGASTGGGPAFSGGPYSIPTYIVICESGGNYAALNASSGAGGAYQIIPSTWAAYGGSGLPHQASKAEQDRIAALIWADSGPSAWSCA